jgi:hypothetical protein
MSRLDEYHRWLVARARLCWLESLERADYAEKHKADKAGNQLTQEDIQFQRDMANTDYQTYCVVNLDCPENYRAHKRIKKLRKARGSNL